jgi:glycosyltransferase involved in cell wall biosynthesis
MKILYFADHKSPHTRRWAEWMIGRGHSVTIFSLSGEDKVDITGTKYHKLINLIGISRINNRILRIIVGYFWAVIIRIKIWPDIVHAHSTGSYSWLAALTGLGPLIVTPWGKDLVEDLRPSWWEFLLTKSSLMRAVAITTDGAHLIPILNSLSIRSTKIYKHEWGVDTEFYSPLSLQEIDYRKRNRRNNIFRLVSTRTPTPVHDVECLIRACRELVKSISEFELIIVGDGSNLVNLQNMVNDSNIQEKVFFTGMLDQFSLLAILQSSDLYVSTSPVDAGLSVSSAEAMSCGLPVIHPDVADNAKWTPEGVGGLLYPAGDHSRLAESIAFFINGGNIGNKMGKTNRNSIVSRNDKNKNMKIIEDIYFKVIN